MDSRGASINDSYGGYGLDPSKFNLPSIITANQTIKGYPEFNLGENIPDYRQPDQSDRQQRAFFRRDVQQGDGQTHAEVRGGLPHSAIQHRQPGDRGGRKLLPSVPRSRNRIRSPHRPATRRHGDGVGAARARRRRDRSDTPARYRCRARTRACFIQDAWKSHAETHAEFRRPLRTRDSVSRAIQPRGVRIQSVRCVSDSGAGTESARRRRVCGRQAAIPARRATSIPTTSARDSASLTNCSTRRFCAAAMGCSTARSSTI